MKRYAGFKTTSDRRRVVDINPNNNTLKVCKRNADSEMAKFDRLRPFMLNDEVQQIWDGASPFLIYNQVEQRLASASRDDPDYTMALCDDF